MNFYGCTNDCSADRMVAHGGLGATTLPQRTQRACRGHKDDSQQFRYRERRKKTLAT
jgi:hypothetical protein